MAFSFYALVLLVHVLGAVMWLGGGAYHISIIQPAVRAAGPAGGAVMMQVLRRGGMGARWFGPVSLLTVIAGFYLYVRGGFTNDPFATVPSTLLTAGVLAGLAAFVVGLAVQMPLEMKMRRVVAGLPDGPPPAQDMARLQALVRKAEIDGRISVALVALATVLMAGRGVVA